MFTGKLDFPFLTFAVRGDRILLSPSVKKNLTATYSQGDPEAVR